MSLLTNNPQSAQYQRIITDFIQKEFGHFVVASDDRIFINVLRRSVVSDMGLPSNAITIITNHEHIVKCVREMSVKKKTVILFIQPEMDNKRIDDTIKFIAWKVHNCKVVIVTTESDLHRLALLREQKIADNWIIKPVVINQLLAKVAMVIRPYGNLEKLIRSAEDCLRQGAYRQALTTCRKIFEANPDSAVAHMLMGDAYRGLEQITEMVEAYEQASFLDELFLEPLFKLVEFFREQGDMEREVSYLERLDALSPLNVERKMEIAKLHLQMGHGEDAEGTFDSVMRMTTRSVADTVSAMATKIGSIYAAAKNPSAEKYFRKAIEAQGGHLDKSHLHLFNNLGIFLRKNGKLKESLEEYGKALEIAPDSAAVRYNMALAYHDGGKLDEACVCLRQAQNAEPEFFKKDTVVALNTAMIFAKHKEADLAASFANQALVIDPDCACARKLLASLGREAPAEAPRG